ncbi:ferritin-like domain-containing protein [Streptomyces spinosisporus]|uniref:Ferritin-like protein n=1 Tax=Streptomyces spinosisporus TaxID=2927582 RepID=A0ABS9XJ58_9ACTN|nr:ferritin-like protein [Streptomyces spinosisporus]MCI3242043.1 ferritin-like protein [Streptomyces spinosisporus]
MTGTTEDSDSPAVAPFKRRTFLASAAVAAGTPVVAAGAAQAAARPVGQAPAAPRGHSVARLLAVPHDDRGLSWLRQSLQVAVALELATIPPYLCGWWSIKDRGSEAARLIRRIVGDEMYHLGTVCNLLVAVGGRPQIKSAASAYPGPLPGGVRPGLTVYLSGLTRSFVLEVMMAIEEPDEPLARSVEPSPSVGTFYGDILRTFRSVAPELQVRGQLSARIGSDVLEPVRSPDDVMRAIEIIKEQGEGTDTSPATAFDDDYPAHYYAFGEIYHGRRLRETDSGWEFSGAPVRFPDVRPMAPVPVGGWSDARGDVRRLLDGFDATYHSVLQNLETAWSGGGRRTLNSAIHAMRGLEHHAVELMERPIPDAPGTYGPQFRPF